MPLTSSLAPLVTFCSMLILLITLFDGIIIYIYIYVLYYNNISLSSLRHLIVLPYLL